MTRSSSLSRAPAQFVRSRHRLLLTQRPRPHRTSAYEIDCNFVARMVRETVLLREQENMTLINLQKGLSHSSC